MRNMICFDLEGPLSPQDNAYELMGLFENGYQIFEVISRYDDLLTLEGRKDYEAGDTLKLIVPFLISHNIREEDITKISKNAFLVDGARELISNLKRSRWQVYIISTSYQQHAYNIGQEVNVLKENIACTHFSLNKYLESSTTYDLSLVQRVEDSILELTPQSDDAKIKELLDKFYYSDLLRTELGKELNKLKIMGGARKVQALESFAEKSNIKPTEVVAVGDSITDYKMLEFVRKNNGLAIVFNGNEYALPYGTVGVASTTLTSLMPILDLWKKGGLNNIFHFIRNYNSHEEPPYYHILQTRRELKDIIEVHKKMRKLVRGRAGKLG